MKIKKELFQNLYEALDAQGQPLCLLGMDEILRQNLYHRRIALMVVDKRGKMLLNTPENEDYDFLFSGPVPAAWSKLAYAEQYSLEHLKNGHIKLLCELPPTLNNSRAFCSVYQIEISNSFAEMLALDKNKRLLLDKVELNALINMALPFSQLFKQFYLSYLK